MSCIFRYIVSHFDTWKGGMPDAGQSGRPKSASTNMHGYVLNWLILTMPTKK